MTNQNPNENKFIVKLKNDNKNFKINMNHDPYWENDFLKDCPNYPFVPTILPKTERIIVMGDIHGDYNLAVNSFKLAKLIDDNYNWIAIPKNTVVVQVGDQIDSCRPIRNVYSCTEPHNEDTGHDMNVMIFFDDMHKKAHKYGGAVYSLIGNHELMNSQGLFGYVSHNNLYKFEYEDTVDNKKRKYTGIRGREKAFAPGGPVANNMGCTRNSVMIIGSNMFVHAGILPEIIQKFHLMDVDENTKLKYLNSIVRKWLLKKLIDKNDTSNLNNMFNDMDNLFWTRKLGEIGKNAKLDSVECSNSVKKTMDVFKIGQIVVGHSPQFIFKDNRGGINGTCEDQTGKKRLYRVDNGLSIAFNIFGKNINPIQVLEILNDNEFNIITDTNIRDIKIPDIGITTDNMDHVAKIFAPGRI